MSIISQPECSLVHSCRDQATVLPGCPREGGMDPPGCLGLPDPNWRGKLQLSALHFVQDEGPACGMQRTELREAER
jgi:hypothetical protein